MRRLDSLPGRPLRYRDLELIEDVAAVKSTTIRYFASSNHYEVENDDPIGQFDIFLKNGRAFALHLDVEALEWFIVDELQDVEDFGEAIEEFEAALEVARGDPAAYGRQLVDLGGGST